MKNITTNFNKKIKKIKKNFKNQFSKKFLKKSKIYVKFVVIFFIYLIIFNYFNKFSIQTFLAIVNSLQGEKGGRGREGGASLDK
jgi:hypothetical protein